MNIEIANRLFELRKKNGFSQEDLAEKIGVSRQAISKWERAESSPDTNNLIEISRLYGVSLDELLFTTETVNSEKERTGDSISITPEGIHIVDKDGAQVRLNLKEEKKDFATRAGETWEKTREPLRKVILAALPAPIIVTALYVAIGYTFNQWTPTWLLFLMIPIYYQLLLMVKVKGKQRKLNCFPIALICLVIFLILGLLFGLWHPGWLVFLVIPLYYVIVNAKVREEQ
ncbi:MAG: helix-turn-helix transcriptional regulator [Oscillospiraceae bacterium]|nr:helix-turn-helix transcriptional regulator [Oscillospiraceae bacterium]